MNEQNKSPEEIKDLEERLARLESFIAMQSLAEASKTEQLSPAEIQNEEEDFEMRISQYWLPKLGISVFVIGILILLIQPLDYFPDIVPVLVGYGVALIVAALSHIIKKYLPEFYGYIIGGSAAIAFLATLRLHFYGNTQIVSSLTTEIILLFFICSSTLAFALRYKSIYLTVLGLIFGFISIDLITSPLLQFLMLTGYAGFIVFISIRFEWKGLVLFGVIASYFSFLNCCFGNAIVGNSLALVPDIQFYFLFVFIFSAIYSSAFLSAKAEADGFIEVITTFIASAGGYGLFLIMTLLNNKDMGTLHFIGAVINMLLAISFWTRLKSQYSTFIFAMIAYAALSVTIIFLFEKPAYFILLGWQSLVVLATSLWFRSRFIVVTNLVIFSLTLLGYLITGQITFSGFSFGLIALVSARVLHLNKDRLELKTEKMRIIYLSIALLWNPYFIYSTLSGQYVALTLLALALFYFIMSKLINNLKYRIMAVLTLVITVCYLMLFGITNPDLTYKVISFLSAGIVLFLTSAAYSRMKRKMKKA